MIWLRILLVVIGYGFGLFQTGYIYGKAKGIDIRQKGSGNTGATNALRTLGVKGGIIVLAGDALKALIPCLAVRLIFMNDPYWPVYVAYAAIGVSLGNNYPFFLKFQGGKGIATTAGWWLAWNPLGLLIGVSIFALLAVTTGFVSLGSLTASLSLIIYTVIYGLLNFSAPFTEPVFIELLILVVFAVVVIFVRHRGNVVRLLTGTENGFKKKKEE